MAAAGGENLTEISGYGGQSSLITDRLNVNLAHLAIIGSEKVDQLFWTGLRARQELWRFATFATGRNVPGADIGSLRPLISAIALYNFEVAG